MKMVERKNTMVLVGRRPGVHVFTIMLLGSRGRI